jgi:hypothetical protein
MEDYFEPAFMPWKELTVEQRGEIVWNHEMFIADFESLSHFMEKIKSLVWSRDSRPPEKRLVIHSPDRLELTSLWYGFNEERNLEMKPPSMCRLSDELIEAMESKLHTPSIPVTISPYAAKVIARALVRYADNRRALATETKGMGCAHEMCLVAAEEAETAAGVLGQRVAKFDAENLIW